MHPVHIPAHIGLFYVHHAQQELKELEAFTSIKSACLVRVIYIINRPCPMEAKPDFDLIISLRGEAHFIQTARLPRLSILLHTPQGDKFFM